MSCTNRAVCGTKTSPISHAVLWPSAVCQSTGKVKVLALLAGSPMTGFIAWVQHSTARGFCLLAAQVHPQEAEGRGWVGLALCWLGDVGASQPPALLTFFSVYACCIVS